MDLRIESHLDDEILDKMLHATPTGSSTKKNKKLSSDRSINLDSIFDTARIEPPVNVSASISRELLKKIDEISELKRTSRAEVIRKILEAVLQHKTSQET